MEKIITAASGRISNIDGLMYIMENPLTDAIDATDKNAASVLGSFYVLWEELHRLSNDIDTLERKIKEKKAS